METLIARRLFTVTDYHKMAEAGILNEDDRVELIEGEIVEMSPIGFRHLAQVDHLNVLFMRGLLDKAIVRVQGSVRLNIHSEPQPDLVLLRWRADFYKNTAAGPEDILLIVEVADSSLAYDRDVKAPLYARAGVAEFWLIDLNAESIDVYRGPAPDGFREMFKAQGNDPLSPLAFPKLVLSCKEILI
jgi:Uma2 family endonuclease